MANVRTKQTAPEMRVQRALRYLRISHKLHLTELPGTPDMTVPSLRIAIFVNGCFWHGHSCSKGRLPSSNRVFWERKIENNRIRDRRTLRSLRRLGWKTLTVWECKTGDPDKLCRYLASRLARVTHPSIAPA